MTKLCGAKCPDGGWYCTRQVDHDGHHIATLGPYKPDLYVLAQWLRTKDQP